MQAEICQFLSNIDQPLKGAFAKISFVVHYSSFACMCIVQMWLRFKIFVKNANINSGANRKDDLQILNRNRRRALRSKDKCMWLTERIICRFWVETEEKLWEARINSCKNNLKDDLQNLNWNGRRAPTCVQSDLLCPLLLWNNWVDLASSASLYEVGGQPPHPPPPPASYSCVV